MKHFILLLAILTSPILALPGNIQKNQASLVAYNFFCERATISNSIDLNTIGVKQVRTAGNINSAMYICEMLPRGFVIVSASDNVKPVLAYSFESNFTEQQLPPDGFIAWMNHYSQQIEFSIASNQLPLQNVKLEWQRLLSDNFSVNKRMKTAQSVEPLLVSKWNQDSPYNSWCPIDPAGPGDRCYAGCVATAMGQLLYYYRFPNQGEGSYTYNHPDYGTISADFGATTYQWNGMPSAIGKKNDPIGELLFHQGVSVDMDYGPDGSGMWNHKAAYSLKTYFGYGPETQYYFRDSVSIDWDSLLVTNLDQRKPLYYAGWAGVQSTSGHAFVCDGYQPGNYYHFNWGWGGSLDGYFYTDNLTPGGNDFNFAQEVIPLFPDTVQNNYPNYCQGQTTLTGLRGSVEDGSGWYNYQDNSDCSWLLSPQDEEYDSIKSIKITFLRFDTEAGADTLCIYDGVDESAPMIGTYSGNTLPGTIVSTGNKVFITFHSGLSTNKGGWQFDYESLFPIYCSGTTTLTAPSGHIEDGSGEKKYSGGSVCRWKILPAGEMPVTLNFTFFETYDSLDILKIYDLQTQEVLGAFSGNQLPPSVTAQSGKMLILFMTNTTSNAQGWAGDYFTSGVGINGSDSCLNLTHIFPNPSSGLLTIEKFFRQSAETRIRVIDMYGKTVYNDKIKVFAGFNILNLNFDKLPGSEYLLIVGEDEQKEVSKLIIKD
jgi:hypothetical protein